MHQWEVHKLFIGDNRRASLLKEISHVYFTHLSVLGLWGNQLQSVEALGSVNMPHIQVLHLNRNHIRSVRVMRRTMWAELHQLNIYHNNVCDPSTLAQAFLPGLKRLGVYWDGWAMEQNPFFDACFPAKLQTPFIKHMNIQADDVLIIRSIRPVLEKKWAHPIIE